MGLEVGAAGIEADALANQRNGRLARGAARPIADAQDAGVASRAAATDGKEGTGAEARQLGLAIEARRQAGAACQRHGQAPIACRIEPIRRQRGEPADQVRACGGGFRALPVERPVSEGGDAAKRPAARLLG